MCRIDQAMVALLSGMVTLTTLQLANGDTSHGGRNNPIPPDAASLDVGKRVYQSNCSDCHGQGGKGDGNRSHDLGKDVPDLTSQRVSAMSDAKLFQSISRGKRPMPAFEKELSEQDRWHVINYVRSLASTK